MAREKLPSRRANETRRVEFTMTDDENRPVSFSLLVTVGFDDNGRVKEVYCSSFRAGTAMNAIVMDACLLFSRLLQSGDDPRDIASSLVKPYNAISLVGTIAKAVAETPNLPPRERPDPVPTPPQPPLPPNDQVGEGLDQEITDELAHPPASIMS